jgi:IMP dehydrogenase
VYLWAPIIDPCNMANSNRFISEGLTYDDVLLVPAYSEVLPKDVSIVSRFSKNITIKTPLVSAAMDTVTESKLAIAIAREGGIGVIHKNMTIEQQANEVRRVKRSESGMIQDPVTLMEDQKVGDALRLMAEHNIGGIPIVDKDGMLVGIVTNRDLRFEKDNSKSITDIMTKDHLITVRPDSDLTKAEEILQKHKIEKLPVVNDNGILVGLITFRDIIKVKMHPHSCKDKYGRLRVAAAIGVTADSLKRAEALVEAGVDAIVIDTAHGHTQGVVNVLKEVKNLMKHVDVIVGNIATADGAKFLADHGADAVKVGIGPGSICTTRVIAGVGVPQLTAIFDVAEGLSGYDIPLIADGGVRYSGDLVKALAAGAGSIMVGSMLAGVEESPGETIIYEGRKFKAYRGMGSIEAMQRGSKDRYFQDNTDDISKFVPEGISGKVPFKGSVSEVIYQLVGGLRAGMGYCGAKDIMALRESKFIRITGAGVKESHPHDVSITREAPNYSFR